MIACRPGASPESTWPEMTDPPHVLVAGASTRAIAASAARAGFQVTAVDAFADLDQHPGVQAVSVAGRFSPQAAVRASRMVACDAVAYLSSFENDPDAVRALACKRTLWGNAPEVLRAVRDPSTLHDAFRRGGHSVPALGGTQAGPWLHKPVASGGGTRIDRWTPGQRAVPGHYVQEFIDGQSGSVAFVASLQGVRLLGVFRQLIGMPAFGASGFQYCGNLLDGGTFSAAIVREASALAHTATSEFGLVGVNGIDFVARGDELYPVEVNPRWSASMELVERAHGVSVFAAHAQACHTGELPAFDAMTMPPLGACVGKSVVFARNAVTVGDTHAWCADAHVADVPRPGTTIAAGDPVCTVFAEAATLAGCETALVARARQVFAALRAWTSER